MPGVTWAAGAGELDRKPFVGSAQAGDDAAVIAMDCAFGPPKAKAPALVARKAWAFGGDVMVCLIANLTADQAAGPVRTALDQCRQAGAVTAAEAGKAARALPDGTHKLDKVRWVFHNGLAYMPLFPAEMTVKVGPVTGDWHRINRQYNDKPVADKVFLPVLEHGTTPRAVSCGYAVAAVASPAAAETLAARPTWTVLSNTVARQAVRFADGSIVAAFYLPGSLTDSAGNAILTADAPCLLALRGRDVFASDPTHKGGDLTVTTPDGRRVKARLPADGTVIQAR